MNRQQRRAAAKRRKKGDPNQVMSDQVALFGKLPEACDACQKEFDKKDRDMVMSWSVVVRKETETVRLYCPDCWDMAKKLVEETRDGSEDQISDV